MLDAKKDGKKQIKYTVSLTNMFPSSVEVFMHQNTLVKTILFQRLFQDN